MSYSETYIETYSETENWTLRPLSAFRIKRNCPKCNCKTDFVSTENFRINANGRCVDVWLIYQCEHCRSTYNLPVYERIRPERLTPGIYRQLMENDSQLALKMGLDRALFEKNHAVISDNVPYEIMKNGTIEAGDISACGRVIHIKNPYHLKIRLDKVLAQGLCCLRAQIKKDIRAGRITCAQLTALERAYMVDDMVICVSSVPDLIIDNADEIGQEPSDGHGPPDAGDAKQRQG